MNTEFCINCGHKNLFAATKPKFCAGCGKPFNVTSVAVSSQEEGGESKTNISSFDLKKLRASIKVESEQKKTSLDDLWSNPLSQDEVYLRADPNLPDPSVVLKQNQQDCAPAKQAKNVDE